MSVLEVEGIHTYYGNSHVLRDVSLEVEPGEVVTLLGRNGAGKTTTLRSIVGVQSPREGSVRYRGDEIVGEEVDAISRMGVKMVPEDRRVFPTLTVEENLSVAARLTKDDARSINDMYDLFPKLRELRDSAANNLSGGEQQMLSVARALIQSPDMLLLDEPTEGLAPVIVDDLRGIVRTAVQEDVTVLLTEQNVEFAFDMAERGYVIDTGEIVFEGTVDEMRADEELLETYLSVGSADV